MGKWGLAVVMCLFLAIPAGAKKGHKSRPPAPPPAPQAASYDASRDPAKDLKQAMAEATRTKKRILLEVGGDWCVYCHMMDETFESHPQLQKVRDTYYVTVRVNFSKENPNQEFLSHYPKIADYPHFFVLDSQGALLHSQPTHSFEHGKNYHAGRIEDFLRKWGQPPRHWLTRVS